MRQKVKRHEIHNEKIVQGFFFFFLWGVEFEKVMVKNFLEEVKGMTPQIKMPSVSHAAYIKLGLPWWLSGEESACQC